VKAKTSPERAERFEDKIFEIGESIKFLMVFNGESMQK